jgi:hypothetical protein
MTNPVNNTSRPLEGGVNSSLPVHHRHDAGEEMIGLENRRKNVESKEKVSDEQYRKLYNNFLAKGHML